MAKRKVQKDKQRTTKHTYKTKDRVTRTPRISSDMEIADITTRSKNVKICNMNNTIPTKTSKTTSGAPEG